MSVPTFTPPLAPTPGMKNKPDVQVLRAAFGDGYTQAAPSGLNNVRASYDISWDVLLPDEADDIVGFFEQQQGCLPFFYVVPNTPKRVKFVCEAWTDQINAAGFRAVTATFKQSFAI